MPTPPVKLLRATSPALLLLSAALACQPRSESAEPAPQEPAPRRYAEGATIPITSNDYGRFSSAPGAPEIGDQAPDFQLPLTTGETFQLATASAGGDVVIVFYRGFW